MQSTTLVSQDLPLFTIGSEREWLKESIETLPSEEEFFTAAEDQILKESNGANQKTETHNDDWCGISSNNILNFKRGQGTQANLVLSESADMSQDPEQFSDIARRDDKELWDDAVLQELQSLQKHRTWNVVTRPAGKNVIKCRWVFKTKRNEYGEISRCKARVVVKGYSLKEKEWTTNKHMPLF